jgi:endoglucanase
MPGVNVPAIKVDTVGYPTKWKKVAIANVEPLPNSAVLEDEKGTAVHTFSAADISSRGVDAASKDPVWQLDFSSVEAPGRYRVRVGSARSDVFEIGDAAYARALVAAQKFFYFQRTRTALVEPFAEWEGSKYLRPQPSHVHADVGWDLEDYPQKKRKWNVLAGWHDAGNYDMYVPSTAPTAQALLMAYEAHPEVFRDGDLNIPESKNGVPDVLDEAKWGLDWVLSVQEKESGAFRTREAVMQWSPDLPADQDRTERWIAGPSTSSTAKAVAALAMAARVYRKHDPAFAKRAAEAAQKGWAFLEQHPERIVVDGKGSPQPLWDDEPDRSDTGARFIAAVEMWRTFQSPEALDTARAALASPEAQPKQFVEGAWANLSRWALTSLALDASVPEDVRNVARQRILEAVLPFRARIEESDGYRCASELDDYYWGHNSNLLEKAHLLLVAAELTGERWLVDAARDQWHWILGRNPNGYSMVTRVGKGPDRIYHTEWGRTSPPPPGYLVGGPNAVQMKVLAPDAPAKTLLWDNPMALRSGLPPHSLWHSQQSDLWDGKFVADNVWENGWWSVTEPDIYYNANLVLVGAAMASVPTPEGPTPKGTAPKTKVPAAPEAGKKPNSARADALQGASTKR